MRCTCMHAFKFLKSVYYGEEILQLTLEFNDSEVTLNIGSSLMLSVTSA